MERIQPSDWCFPRSAEMRIGCLRYQFFTPPFLFFPPFFMLLLFFLFFFLFFSLSFAFCPVKPFQLTRWQNHGWNDVQTQCSPTIVQVESAAVGRGATCFRSPCGNQRNIGSFACTRAFKERFFVVFLFFFLFSFFFVPFRRGANFVGFIRSLRVSLSGARPRTAFPLCVPVFPRKMDTLPV